MTSPTVIPTAVEQAIDGLVNKYRADQSVFEMLGDQLDSLTKHPPLAALVHSHRVRLKEPEHLRDKLQRQWRKRVAKGDKWDINEDSLYETINDLAGMRLLHLHTAQVQEIDTQLRKILEEHLFEIREGPTARVWDDEYDKLFDRMGIRTVRNERMYTSVHYVVLANRKTKITAEIQVRTLAEELWGEVDHSLNYPDPTVSESCAEQIRVLARFTSGCTRLVDSIFKAAP